eukprot:scaffold9347_cov110-Isochrysis_galbana.AAC.5
MPATWCACRAEHPTLRPADEEALERRGEARRDKPSEAGVGAGAGGGSMTGAGVAMLDDSDERRKPERHDEGAGEGAATMTGVASATKERRQVGAASSPGAMGVPSTSRSECTGIESTAVLEPCATAQSVSISPTAAAAAVRPCAMWAGGVAPRVDESTPLTPKTCAASKSSGAASPASAVTSSTASSTKTCSHP